MEYHDEQNQLYGCYNFHKGGKTQDYFTGEIKKAGEVVCQIKGNYMGYFEFDGVRYWDRRDKDTHFHFPTDTEQDKLPSDSTNREDSVALTMRTVAEAQEEKEAMEIQ